MLLGGGGVLAVVVLLVAMNSGGGDGDKTAAPTPAEKPNPPAAAPAAAPAAKPAAAPASAPRAGKPPAKPAPTLTAETLQQARQLLQQAKGLCNEGITARVAGNNTEARTKQSAASDKIEALKAMTKTNWDWQEQAEFGEWAMPAEYVALGDIYTEVGTLENKIRKGGGTR